MGKEKQRRVFKAPEGIEVNSTRGFGVIDFVETGTTAANFVNHGLTLFGGTAAVTHTLNAPSSAGQTKHLFCTQSTGVAITVQFSTGTSVQCRTTDGSTMVNLVFDNDGEAATLVSEGTTQWVLMSYVGTTAA